MSQEYKLVPVEPALFLDMGWAYLDAAREAEPNKEWSFSHAGYKAMLAAAPVPAAGDVEVLAVVTLGGYFSSEELGDIDIEPVMSALEQIQQDVVRSDDDEHIELVDRAHVTRLQAEVSALRLENSRFVEALGVAASKSIAERAALQAELTKARELVLDVGSSMGSTEGRRAARKKINAFLARQSEPAATGGSHTACGYDCSACATGKVKP